MKLPDVTGEIVAVDSETTGLHRDDGARLFCVSVARGTRSRSYAFDSPDKSYYRLLEWLSRQKLVMANGKFDLHMFYKWGFDLSDAFHWDVNLATMLLEPTEPVGLKPTCERAFGVDARAEEMELGKWFKANKVKKADRDYSQVPWEIMEPYATKDAELTLRLYHRQVALFEESGDFELREVFAREMELSKVLFKMEKRGIGFDADACRTSAGQLEKSIAALKKKLPFDPQINRAKEYFFGPEGEAIPHQELTAKGNTILDEEMLKRLVDEDITWAEEFQQYRNMEAALTKWYRGWPDKCGADGRLRTVFNQTFDEDTKVGTISGRLSASRVQLQGIPHDHQLPKGVKALRSFIKPKPGHELWELDLSQAEIRVGAYYTKCKPIIAALKVVDADVHAATAKLVFGIDERHEDWDFMRHVAKQLNFSIQYGAGVKTVRALIHKLTGIWIPMHQVGAWITDYHRAYPEIHKLSKKCQVLVEDRGYIRLMGGRKRWYKKTEVTFKAMNSLIQGGVAELVKMWMVCTEQKFPGVLLLQIHDSIVVEVPIFDNGVASTKGVVETIAGIGEGIFTEAFNRPGRDDLHINFVVNPKKWGDDGSK